MGPAFTLQSTRRKGAFAKKISRARLARNTGHVIALSTRLEGRPKRRNHELESWQKIILKYLSSPFFPTPFPKLTFFFHISSSTLYFNIKLYIKLHQPPYGIFLYSSPSPAEHRNSVEKILGRWRETESEGKKVAWKPQRGNDLGPTIEEGGEVDTARCAAVSRWRRRERRLAGFRGCTVGTSPSPCIPIDR